MKINPTTTAITVTNTLFPGFDVGSGGGDVIDEEFPPDFGSVVNGNLGDVVTGEPPPCTFDVFQMNQQMSPST